LLCEFPLTIRDFCRSLRFMQVNVIYVALNDQRSLLKNWPLRQLLTIGRPEYTISGQSCGSPPPREGWDAQLWGVFRF
jgi:hypothetical protein